MIHSLTQFAAEESATGVAALGFSLTSLLIQLVTFVLVFFVLQRFAFKPIGKVLRERRELIETGVTLGEEMKKERAELDQEVANELKEARTKADGIVAAAHDAGRAAITEAETKAREKAEGIVADAKSRGEQDVAQMRKALEKELVGLISDATEAIIDEKVDATKDARLIDKALKGQKSGAAA